jgi:hypothetical protein
MSKERILNHRSRRFWEKKLGEINSPQRNEVSINEVLKYYEQYLNERDIADYEFGKNDAQQIKKEIRKKTKFKEPVIRGAVEIALGDKSSLALNPEQMNAFALIFGLNRGIFLNKKIKCFALLETATNIPITTESLVKVANVQSETNSNMIISKGLAEVLGFDDSDLTKRQEIRILKIYQKTRDINLDKL